MKLLVVSDIHGSGYYARKLEALVKAENPDKIILLGDLYYHGPRNPLTNEYSPSEVCNILNSLKDKILAVKGNCDAEVDQMISEFKIEDHIYYDYEGKTILFTHGHVYNIDNTPEEAYDIMIYGHFHTGFIKEKANKLYINAGSISLPKENTKNSYLIIEDKDIFLKDVEGNIITQTKI